MKIVNARCSNCGSELTYSSDKAMLFCPYCGSKQIIIDGDEVKVAQAKYDAYRDVELAREETEREKNRQDFEREKRIIEKGDHANPHAGAAAGTNRDENKRRRIAYLQVLCYNINE